MIFGKIKWGTSLIIPMYLLCGAFLCKSLEIFGESALTLNIACSTVEEDPYLSINCPEFSSCDSLRNNCVCYKGFSPTVNNTCLSSFNSSCENVNCNPEANLVCDEITRLCKCSSDKSIFSLIQARCLGIVGSSCIADRDCTDEAFCLNDIVCHCKHGYSPDLKGQCRRKYMSPCNINATEENDPTGLCNSGDFFECIDGQCKCRENEKLYDGSRGHGYCISVIGEKCDMVSESAVVKSQRTLECVENAICVNSTCQCLPDMIFSKKQKKCYLLAGKKCTNSNDCTENAWCDPKQKTCQCKKRFSPNYLGKCFHTFGETCKRNAGAGAPRDKTAFVYSCNSLDFLACIDGKCQCDSKSKVWDEHWQVCVSLVGGYCDLEKNPGEKMLFCAGGAVCNSTGPIPRTKDNILSQMYGIKIYPGKCICGNDMIKTENGTCAKNSAGLPRFQNSPICFHNLLSILLFSYFPYLVVLSLLM